MLGYAIKSDRFVSDALATPLSWFENSVPHAANAGVWSMLSSGADITFTGPKHLIAGCYKFTMFVRTGAPVATVLNVSSVITNETCNSIPTTSDPPAITSDIMLAPCGIGERQAMYQGYITVDNTVDIAPVFTIRTTRIPELADGRVYTKVSVTQVSCRLEDSLY